MRGPLVALACMLNASDRLPHQVPVNEMTDVMRVRVDAKKKPLQLNAWVRIRRNDEYKDDLAQVVDLDNDAGRARVRLIPRLRVYVTRGLDDDDTGHALLEAGIKRDTLLRWTKDPQVELDG